MAGGSTPVGSSIAATGVDLATPVAILNADLGFYLSG